MAKTIKFTKEQLMKCSKYDKRKDLLSAVLVDGTEYTNLEAEKLMNDYLKGEVK